MSNNPTKLKKITKNNKKLSKINQKITKILKNDIKLCIYTNSSCCYGPIHPADSNIWNHRDE